MAKVVWFRLPEGVRARLQSQLSQGGAREKRDLPLLSVIMPIYNVSFYLESAVRSLMEQEWPNFQLVAIDDGSSDGSEDIIDWLAAEDRRILVIHQKNQGLGAARNAGIAASTGDYLTFLDSDDLAEASGYRRAIESLESTGSDFAVGSYRLLVNGRPRHPGSWIGPVHAKERLSTSLTEFPEAQLNAIACSKVYRASFFRRVIGEFPVGVLYEDQLPASKAYVGANSFDVLTESMIQWRMRSDGSSITQQNASPDNLRSVVAATESSVEYLWEHAPDAARARALQLLLADTYKLRNLARGDEEYWLIVRDAVARWWNELSQDELVDSVPIGRRVMYAITQSSSMTDAVEYTRLGGLSDSAWVFGWGETDLRRGSMPDDQGLLARLALPDWLLRVGAVDAQVHSCIEWVGWQGDTLVIRGSGYLSGFEPGRAKLSVALVDPKHGIRLELPLRPVLSTRATERTSHRVLDYAGSGFEGSVDAQALASLLERSGFDRLTLQFLLELSVGDLRKSATIVKTDFLRSPSSAQSRVLGDRVRVDFSVKGDLPVITVLRPVPMLVDAIEVSGRKVEIALRDTGAAVNRLKVLHPGMEPVAMQVHPSEGRFGFDLPATKPGARTASRLQVRDRDGHWLSLAIDEATTLTQSSDGEVALCEGYFSQPFFFEGSQHVFVDEVQVEESTLRLWLLLPSVSADGLQVEMVGPKSSEIRGELVRVEGRRALFSFGCESEYRQGWSRRMAVPGRYALRVTPGAGDADQAEFRVQYGDRLSRLLPLRCVGDGDLTVDLLRGPQRSLILVLAVDDGDRHRPAPIRQRLIRSYRASEGKLSPKVYLQCLRGDQVGDSLLPIAVELHAAAPQVQIVWGVVDLSVSVPTAHQRVVIGTPEYFQALSDSAVLFFNHELPDYFVKRSQQVVVQTYHGHPFKMMGMARFEKSGYTEIELARALRARSVWDYLLSPSPIATRLYRENFPLGYEVIEVGHPRNDEIALNDASRRAAVRRQLGIPNGAQAVLYAPTWRDSAATNPWQSAMVDFVDPVELSARLGTEYVVLLRGHPAHGRHHSYAEVADGRVIDVTLYPEINDLIIASDIGVFDYSSIRFDYAVTGRPMVFFVPDEERYFEASPGLLPFDQTTPGPRVTTEDDLVAALTTVSEWSSGYAAEYAEFKRDYCPQDDGHAAQRFVRELGNRLSLRDGSPWGPDWQFGWLA